MICNRLFVANDKVLNIVPKMAQYRPAGLSDEDSDSDGYGFLDAPVRHNTILQQQSTRKKLEINFQDAVINSDLGEVEKIVTSDLNNNFNEKLDSGWTPLMHACFHAQENIVKFLLDKGADPNLHSDSVTPIMVALSNSSASDETINNIISSLLEKECILNIGDKFGQTPLMRAISSGRVPVVKELLDRHVNIEMRDQQGWTALFWTVHHNKPEALEILISHGARLNEVDRSGRTLMDIALLHEHEAIIEILEKHQENSDVNSESKPIFVSKEVTSWHDFYPGIIKKGKPKYTDEIYNLLYGMNCDRLAPLIEKNGIDLRTFLLLEEKDMVKLGVDMPYERQRLSIGLRNFHKRGWKLDAVSGLYARKNENYSTLECLTTLGSHLQQIYILEATVQYMTREYKKVQDQLKFEPPDSPALTKLSNATKKMYCNINSIRKEVKTLKLLLKKISKDNPQPVNIIKAKSATSTALEYMTEIIVVCSLGLLAYHAKTIIKHVINK